MDSTWIGLAEAVHQLRAELETAMAEGADKHLRFELGPIELEFQVDLRRTGGVDGALRWGVVSLGGKKELSSGSGHRVTLVLNPKNSVTGENAEVSAMRWLPGEKG
ncbi:trypco2 family protein [Streptomyces sp. NPDC059578]|uniref:trypco2 family protein n=1 Tax=Streptomyces sp. NPDC059578 TaxID=3346874 RepID=UPI00367B10C3